nr:hypothetical protein [Enterobacter cloacae complex sp. 2DZ2F20B]
MKITKRKRNSRRIETYRKRYCGRGIVNSVINKLPFELHIPGYNFCGPGTKLEKRLARGDKGRNQLDEACKFHDIAYGEHKDLENRHKADKVLLDKAKLRLRSSDASLGEKAAALGVAAAMKAKIKLGMGCRVKRQTSKRGKVLNFNVLRKSARLALKNKKFKNMNDAVKVAMRAVKSSIGKKRVRPVRHRRIIPIPKSGGFLPLLPIFAALGALGSLGGGAAAIAKAVNDAKSAKEQLKENQRHNQKMESIAVGKSGSGLYLKPYKRGYGLFLAPSKFQKNSR